MEGDIITLQDVFLFDYKAGMDETGKYLGQMKPTGLRPQFLDRLQDRGVTIPPNLFVPGDEGSAHPRRPDMSVKS